MHLFVVKIKGKCWVGWKPETEKFDVSKKNQKLRLTLNEKKNNLIFILIERRIKRSFLLIIQLVCTLILL